MTGRSEHLQGIAERYRRAGYSVAIEPPGTAMPPRLCWLQGDLIATRGDERVLVLVDGDEDQLQLLSAVVEQTDGWCLDVHRFDPANAESTGCRQDASDPVEPRLGSSV